MRFEPFHPVWPYAPATIHTLSQEALGDYFNVILQDGSSASWASATWRAANEAFYIPFTVQQIVTAYQMFTYNGATANANIDVGIYDSASTRLINSGSTAQSGTNTLQFFNITDTILPPGLYWMACQFDATTGTIFRHALNTKTVYGYFGEHAETVGSFGLPSTATMVRETGSTAGFIPHFGVLCTPTAV